MAGALIHLASAISRCGVVSNARQLWFLQRKKGLRRRFLHRYGTSPDPEIREVATFVAAHPELDLPLGMIPPYEWIGEHRADAVAVARDAQTGLWCATVNRHRVFFPRNATAEDIQESVRVAAMEQDPRSPHRYIGDDSEVRDGDVGVFVGASDGIFCLSLLDRLSKAYLFEPVPDWSEPLRATLKPWGDKAEVVPLFLGRKAAAGHVSLDQFFHERPWPNYIQMDVEGAEMAVLEGGLNLLRNSPRLRLSICTYHQRPDFRRFSRLLGSLGYRIGHSPGYYFIGVRAACLRRGVLYASRGG